MIAHGQTDAEQLPLQAKKFLSIKSAAEYADLSQETIRKLLAMGKLTALRPVRGKILINRTELENLISSSTSTPRNSRGAALHS